MTAYPPFKHLAYINKLRAGLSQPLTKNLSDSCAETYTMAKVLAMDNSVNLNDIQLGYATFQGSLDLRQAISELHQPHNLQEIGGEQVITYSGAQEAIFGVFNALLAPGDEVICYTPNYPSLTELPKQLGAKVIEIPVIFAEQKSWQFDLDTLRAKISNKTKLIVINSPHNPSGALLTKEQATAIVELAASHGIYLLADEVSVFSDHHQLGLNYGFLDYNKTISICVMSKSFGLAGVRVGWAICKDEKIREKLLAIKGYGSICGSATDDVLATIAINNRDEILQRNNRIIAENIDIFSQVVANSTDKLHWSPPLAGIMSLVKICDEHPVDQVALKLATDHQTLMLPGHLFGIKGNYFRLGLGRKNFAEAVKGLEQVLAIKAC